MALIKSISGFRGTIGGNANNNLTPDNILSFTLGFAQYVKEYTAKPKPKIVVGRDGRISGQAILNLVSGALNLFGVDVVNIDLTTTPTLEMLVPQINADAGIILTASHNPKEWNALKFVNNTGEFISADAGKLVLEYADQAFDYPDVDALGVTEHYTHAVQDHINAILADDLVNVEAIKAQNFKVLVDGINSSGGVFIPMLLEALGVEQVELLNEVPNGNFAHNPEPLAVHLKETCEKVLSTQSHMAIVVDPDVDRLAFVDEKGQMFGEEYTLVAVADYILGKRKGNTVSNLSSSRALRDIAHKHGVEYAASAVGEVNVVNTMKATNAVIGGEGNGGVIYPPLHHGRDAMIGIALFLSYVAEQKQTLSEIKAGLPRYFMEKNKIQLNEGIDVDELLNQLKQTFSKEEISTVDGVKIDFADGWVHLRKSNTEPIIRVYSEGKSVDEAKAFVTLIMNEVDKILKPA